jgi:hypothetical protein
MDETSKETKRTGEGDHVNQSRETRVRARPATAGRFFLKWAVDACSEKRYKPFHRMGNGPAADKGTKTMANYTAIHASSNAGLSDDEIYRIAPSVFQTEAHESRSD